MTKQWEDKSQWMTHCPICFCATTHQLLDFHIQYHENLNAISEVKSASVENIDLISFNYQMPPSKKIDWSYYKKLNTQDDAIFLSGHISGGSILTSNKVDYGDVFNLSFSALFFSDPHEDAALLDIDFYDDSNNFISFVIVKDLLTIVVKDNNKINHLINVKPGNEWVDFEISLRSKNLVVSVDGEKFKYKFKKVPGPLTIAFSSNDGLGLNFEDKTPSFGIKNVIAETGHGDIFILDVGSLNEIKE